MGIQSHPSNDNYREGWDRVFKKEPDDKTGENNPKAKLTAFDIESIRWLHTLGFTQAEIARAYNTSQANVLTIIRGASWQEK